eukprot:CFRG4540T1
MEFQNRWTAATGRQFMGLQRPESVKTTDTVFFVALADPQFGLMHEDVRWEEEQSQSERAVVHINRLKPDFVIICGDLVNHMVEIYPGTDPQNRVRQIDAFKETYTKIDSSIPLVCVCGNHDVGDKPTPTTIKSYTKDFGDDYFSFYVKNVKGIVLNSSLLHDPDEAKDEYNNQNEWFKNELRNTPEGFKVLLFIHHPLFIKSANETAEDLDATSFVNPRGEVVSIPDNYFHIPLARRKAVMSLLYKHNVNWVFSGHRHKCAVEWSKEFNINMITTGSVGMALGKDPPGLRLVVVKDGAVRHKYFSLDECPNEVSAKNVDW